MAVDKNAGKPRKQVSRQRRRAIILDMLDRIERLTNERQLTADAQRRQEIPGELRRLRSLQRSLSRRSKPDETALMPKTYVERRKAEIEKAAAISGRSKIRARFVQGGSPGSKGGGKK